MFLQTVSVLVAALLVISGGAAIHLGVFKAGRHGMGSTRKALTGLVSYGVAALYWYGAYGFHSLGW
ncbi:conserved domain protein [delta proteobacterium NaphS2]|nr:conserved domain protein [delta proteobacterium NaphS2]